MNLVELKQVLLQTGYPVAYLHFSKAPSIPFITYQEVYSSNFIAENKVHHKLKNIQIELYTKKKDLDAEIALENLLDSNELPYQTTEAEIESEKLFQKIYEVRLI
jgi:hypothetical protein